jgi:hypothetical protein
MNGYESTVPVLLLGFNRPDKLRRALEPLRTVRPERLFVAVDGPRADRPDDVAKCAETRKVAEEAIDWPCQVHRLFRPANLGCRAAVSGAISWAFEQVEELIVVEDDCILDPSFFAMCRTLLDRHRDDFGIFNIAAVNFQEGQWRGDGDYFVSKYPHCWGWATWKDRWRHYSDDLGGLNSAFTIHDSEREREYWRLIYEKCVRGKVDSWAYRWTFRCWEQGGLTLLPNVNLVHNIGFDEEGTHTREGDFTPKRELGRLASFRSPSSLQVCEVADQFTFNHVFCPPGSLVEQEVAAFLEKDRARVAKEKARAEREQSKQAKGRAEPHPLKRWWRRVRGK